jgi:hypothetical protein
MRSALEDFSAMIGEEMWMSTKIDSLRTTNAPIGVDETPNRVGDLVARHKHREIVVDRDQSTIKHPMDVLQSANAVAHGV